VSDLVKAEGPGFTDYLNFFELLAYLHKSEPISTQEVSGVFDYYLKSLKRHKDVADYIATPSKGFETLNELLNTINQGNRK
jgi:hypothetical protein